MIAVVKFREDCAVIRVKSGESGCSATVNAWGDDVYTSHTHLGLSFW